MKKNVISFSLYGENPIYTIGCIKNAELYQSLFPGWEMWVYHDNSVNEEILLELLKHNVILIKVDDNNGFYGSTWRFQPISNDNVERFISRDCDSRISIRDVHAINEWIDSDYTYNIIRDHPIGHGWVMNAGMWGAKGGIINDINNNINDYSKHKNIYDKAIDQEYLRDIIYPKTINNCLIHDEYFRYEGDKCTNIKHNRSDNDFAFIGESIDENDIPRGDQRTPIISRFI